MLLPRLLGRVCLPAYLNSHLHLSRCMTTTASLDFTQYDSAQLAMMEEMCIVVDFDDAVIGEGTKKDVHLIDGVCMLPAGPPHRAFSVFLFDEQWRLLLQKRCSDKILFPLHWANTCCSHPLFGQVVNEVDEPLKPGAEPMGVKHAAVRKIRHELGTKAGAAPALTTTVSPEATKVRTLAPLTIAPASPTCPFLAARSVRQWLVFMWRAKLNPLLVGHAGNNQPHGRNVG